MSLNERQMLNWKMKNLAVEKFEEMNETQKRSLTHDLDQMLLSCFFNSQPCTSHDFQWEFSNVFGNCFSFSSGFNASNHKVDLKYSYSSGYGQGLRFDLYVNSHENLTSFNSITGGMGAIIHLSNTSVNKFTYYDGIRVSPGSETSLGVRRSFKKNLPKPYSDCDLSSDTKSPSHYESSLYKLILNSKYAYTRDFCVNQCLQKFFIETSNCTYASFASVFNKTKLCTNQLFDEGANNYYNIFLAKDYLNQICMPQCPLECNSTEFLVSQSSIVLIGNVYDDLIKKKSKLASDFVKSNVTPDVAKQSVARVVIFYESLSYKLSEETPQWLLSNLIASIGGNLGLFLGVSSFSICEIITTLIELSFFGKSNKIETIL
jgi:hypothetical protein